MKKNQNNYQIEGGRYLVCISLKWGISEKDAEKYMNAMTKYLKNRMNKKMNCEVLIGLADMSGQHGEYVAVCKGKVGRPSREYVGTPNAYQLDFKNPHLHILLHGRNTDKIIKWIRKHVAMNADKTYASDVDEKSWEWGAAISYVEKQCKKYRYLICGEEVESPLRKWQFLKYKRGGHEKRSKSI